MQAQQASKSFRQAVEMQALHAFDNGRAPSFWRWLKPTMPSIGWDELACMLEWMGDFACNGDEERRFIADVLTLIRDRRYDRGTKRRASVLGMVDHSLVRLFDQAPTIDRSPKAGERLAGARLTWEVRRDLRPPQMGESMLLVDTLSFPPEGDESAARAGWCRRTRWAGTTWWRITGVGVASLPVVLAQTARAHGWTCTAMWAIMLVLAWMAPKYTYMVTGRTRLGKS